MSIWSPTQVERYLLCPQKWKFELDRGEQPPTFQQLVGTSIHAGMLALMQHDEVDPVNAARATFDDLWHEGLTEDPTLVWAATERGLLRLMAKESELLADHGRVRGCEVRLGEGERPRYPGTADLVTEHGTPEDRYLVVTDYKAHWTMDDRWVMDHLTETERSWQLHQYAWFAQEYYGLPVRYIRKAMVRCHPQAKAWIHSHPLAEGKLARWYDVALRYWAAMSLVAEGTSPMPNWTSCKRYGQCEFYYRKECHG